MAVSTWRGVHLGLAAIVAEEEGLKKWFIEGGKVVASELFGGLAVGRVIGRGSHLKVNMFLQAVELGDGVLLANTEGVGVHDLHDTEVEVDEVGEVNGIDGHVTDPPGPYMTIKMGRAFEGFCPGLNPGSGN